MNRTLFIQKMKELKQLMKHERNIDKAMKELDDNFGSFSLGNSISLLVELLQIAMQDDQDWISYYIWETDWGTNSCADSVTDSDGTRIPFKTIGDVYDMIISERDLSELEQYKLLYENEKNHTASLQKLVDRLGERIKLEDFRSEVNKYFTEKSKPKAINNDFNAFIEALFNIDIR